ncbi:exodeoxyribonuclease VII small subunit [Algisphaera agarilytica]|uniref:Exodeoxyribonuclease 7 small subunit n=1 Tax=Algisphaera agarilytica TaxID=1385975 RepID=A0A7X0H513_9BACT|nr:exodeoxyribonuclease VII small subunit [Algisphaera agarilytica]MBB6428271.1 exodeoxyribonuclease VII small subunit [Algisphaera agarilytica]
MTKKAPSFEQAIDQLEELIEQIESGEIGLEDALKRYEDGTKLIQRCRSILDSAEKKIGELTADGEAEGDSDAE